MFIKILIISILTISTFAKDIKTLNFDGNIDLLLGEFSQSNLEKACNIYYPSFYKIWQKSPEFDENEILFCSESIKEYSQSLGYYKVDVSYKIENTKATIKILKNEQIKINSIEIEDEYKNIINIQVGDYFNASNFTASKKEIYKYLNEKGYGKAKLDAKAYIDIDDYKVDIVYKITKNNLQHFGDINIENNAKIDSEYLNKEIKFKKGELYNSLLIDKTYENLYNFGIYKYIAIEQNIDNQDDTIPINIKLVEGDYRETSYGIGYDTDTKARFKAQYKNDNFLGNLRKLTIGTKINEQGYQFYNNLYNPYFILDEVALNNDLTYENIDYESYSQEKIEEKIYLSKDFWELNNNLGFLIEQSKIDSKLIEYQSGSYLLNSIFYEITYDKRDSSLNPKDGYYLSFYIENGNKILLSEENYIKTLTELRYIKSFDKLTTSIKTKIGTLDKDLPIFKHFFAGGDYSNRGYAYQKLGKLDSDDNPYGGLSLIDSSFEIEYNIYKDVGIATFFDSTMLSQKAHTFNEEFYNSYGIGGRYYTPIGPLRVDLGIPVKDTGFVFHIGIGQVF